MRYSAHARPPRFLINSIHVLLAMALTSATGVLVSHADAEEPRPRLRSTIRPFPLAPDASEPQDDPQGSPDPAPMVDGPWNEPGIELQRNTRMVVWGATDPALEQLVPRAIVNSRSDPEEIASLMQSMPEGCRVLNPRELVLGLLTDPRDVCLTPTGQPTNQRGIWADRGVEIVRERLDDFFSEFKAAGGLVDYVFLDYERGYRWPSIRSGGHQQWRAIQRDPRFGEIASQLGYTRLADIDRDQAKRLRWDAVMEGQRTKFMNLAITDVVHQYFPDAAVSNYHSFLIDEEHAVPDFGGVLDYRLGNGFGTHDAAKSYGIIKRGLARQRLDGRHRFGNKPFAGVLFYVNRMRAMRRSSDRPFQPWIVGYSHTRAAEHAGRRMVISQSQHYDDYVFQYGVHGCREIVCWNVKESSTNRPGTFSLPEDDIRLNALIRELNYRLAGEWGETVTVDPIPWDSKIIASGLHVDDRIVWRLTLDEGIAAVEVRIGNVVHELEPEPHRSGLWVEHPASQELSILRLIES